MKFVYLLEVDDGNDEYIKGIYSTYEKAKSEEDKLEEGLYGFITEYEVK